LGSSPVVLHMKMEQIECSETSAYVSQTAGNYPKENVIYSEHGESLKSRIIFFFPEIWSQTVYYDVCLILCVYLCNFVIFAASLMFCTTEVLTLIYFVAGEYVSAVCQDTPVSTFRWQHIFLENRAHLSSSPKRLKMAASYYCTLWQLP